MTRRDARDAEAATTDRLIHDLAADLEPVRPVKVARLLACCLALEIAVVAALIFVLGLRTDIAARLSEPVFLFVLTLLSIGAAWCTSVAIRLAVPGRAVSQPIGWAMLAIPLVLAAVILAFQPAGASFPGLSALGAGCLSCAGYTAVGAAAPWLIMLGVLGRLAPLNELRIGMYAGFAAFLIGAIATELRCASDSGYHIALGHYLPVIVFSAVSCVIAAAILRRRSAIADRR